MPSGTVTVQSSTGLCTWSGWAGSTTTSTTLSVTAEVDVDESGGLAHNSVSYTLDGSTWTSFFSTTTALASTTYTAPIPAGTNLASVAVQASSYCTVARQGGNYADATITVSNLEIT